jgi:hypothetical protein
VGLEVNQVQFSFDLHPDVPLPREGSRIEISLDPKESIQVICTSLASKETKHG